MTHRMFLFFSFGPFIARHDGKNNIRVTNQATRQSRRILAFGNNLLSTELDHRRQSFQQVYQLGLSYELGVRNRPD